MDLSGVVSSFAVPGGLSLTRRASGSYDSHGVYTVGSTSTVTVEAFVAPASPKDVQVLPEGLRSEQALLVFSTAALQAAEAPNGVRGDTFTYEGETYEVQQVEPWSQMAGYWRALASKVTQ